MVRSAHTQTRSTGTRPRRRTLARGLRALGLAAALTLLLPPALAWAAPPAALPQNATAADLAYQPAFDYDTDGCYPTPAIGRDGTLNPGLNTSGALNGSCRDASDLDNTNSYARTLCNNGWCAHMYGLYFEKDQTVNGCCGHRHDWEHVIVWVNGGQVRYVSTSAHGDYDTAPASAVAFEGGTHAKVVYHKDGASTHAFRRGSATEPPENHFGAWQYPDLVSWDGYPAGIRDILVGADFGSAQLALRDGSFRADLNEAKPGGIPFDAFA